MGNPFFKFKQFTIFQDKCAMKVTTDACLFGGWVASISEKPENILDIGAGTGLLSLMLAQVHTSLIDCIEIDMSAFEQLCLNIKASPWPANFHPHNADISRYTTSKKYDLIISNPPFHEHQLETNNLSTNLARHSDMLNLLELFKSAGRLAAHNAKLYILLPYYRKNECMHLAQTEGWNVHQIAEVRQTSKHPYFRVMLGLGKHESYNTHQEIVIKSDNGEYSMAFNKILKEYYLFL